MMFDLGARVLFVCWVLATSTCCWHFRSSVEEATGRGEGLLGEAFAFLRQFMPKHTVADAVMHLQGH